MSRHSSPAAQLLRNSRLFSLPQALPKPIAEQFIREGMYRSSDSASTPYPLRQAIVTPASSNHRGDWGLKRSLPKRGANRASTNPTHTVIANDTYEGITEFHSANPHVKTLEKFQELNIAMTRQELREGSRDSKVSAMQSTLDFTDARMGGKRRWKFAGGGVRTMAPAEFDTYLQEKVAGRKDEFMQQLRARAHLQMLEEQRDLEKKQMQEAREDAETIDPMAFNVKNAYVNWLVTMKNSKPAALVEYLASTEGELPFSLALSHGQRTQGAPHQLENDTSPDARRLKEKLDAMPERNVAFPPTPRLSNLDSASLIKFFELAENIETTFLNAFRTGAWDPDSSRFKTYLQLLRADTTQASPLNAFIRDFLDIPPLKLSNVSHESNLSTLIQADDVTLSMNTHPTAGLSYLRTNKILHNHPLLGPQKSNPPVKARFFAKTSQGKSIYGVAGFIAQAEQGQNNRESEEHVLGAPGGAKAERSVKGAFVSRGGKVVVMLANDSRNNEAVHIRDGGLVSGRGSAMSNQLMGLLRGAGPSQTARPTNAPKAKPLDDAAVDKLKELQKTIEATRH